MPRAIMARRKSFRAAKTARWSRATYADIELRARKLMGVLRELGVQFGDRVATLAMNSDRHLELYYAISGMGAICHTINPRLSVDDIGYILDHAEDGVLFVDPGFLPLAEGAAARTPSLRAIVVLGEEAEIGTCYPPHGKAVYGYETLMSQAATAPDWPEFDENTASRPVLHLGNDGPSEGRALFAPLQPAARLRRCACPTGSACAPRTASCRSCPCSTSTPGGCPMPRP